MDKSPLLSVENLTVGFTVNGRLLHATEAVSFKINQGESLGIVGESGCGKTALAMAILRLLPHPKGKIVGGHIFYQGEDIVPMKLERLYQIRGGEIGFIFQEPMTALNPVMTIRNQVTEAITLHRKINPSEALLAAIQLLEEVGIEDPKARLKAYPHELSGGLRQRVGIALALAGNPTLLIADEPTTSLDASHKAQILELLKHLQKKRGLGLLFITHELGLIRTLCDRIAIMYAGQIVETGTTHNFFEKPRHPYTRALLAALPSLTGPKKDRLNSIIGHVPSLGEWPKGCRFVDRCPHTQPPCHKPQSYIKTDTGPVLCHRVHEL